MLTRRTGSPETTISRLGHLRPSSNRRPISSRCRLVSALGDFVSNQPLRIVPPQTLKVVATAKNTAGTTGAKKLTVKLKGRG
jgi:hypothetical protein